MDKEESYTFDDEIAHILEDLSKMSVDSEAYAKATQNLKTIVEAKKSERRFDPNQILGVAANLLGILLIINHENFNVISTKAISLLSRPRI